MSAFTSTITAAPCLAMHVQALHNHPDEYLAGLRSQLQNGDSFKRLESSQRALVAAATHITGHHKICDAVLQHCSIIEIQKLLTLVSRPSRRRQLAKKIAKIEKENPHLTKSTDDSAENDSEMSPKRKRKKGKVHELGTKLQKVEKELGLLYLHEHHRRGEQLDCQEAHVDPAVCELIQSSSCSGALARKIRKWAKTFKPDYLEFVMLEMPKSPWAAVADFVHFRPQDFAVSYFLADVFGASIPEDSFVFVVRQLFNAPLDNVHELFTTVVTKFPQVYEAYASLRLKPFMHQSR